MKNTLLVPIASVWLISSAFAQQPVYVCDKEYTNTITAAQAAARKCKLLSGGNVSVVQAQKPHSNRVAAASQPGQKVDSGDQRAKDSDSRLILESELKKAEARHAELLREYNNGEPEKLGPEIRNNQKYLDRVAELKASISRNESDIDGIRRELSRLPSAQAQSSSASK